MTILSKAYLEGRGRLARCGLGLFMALAGATGACSGTKEGSSVDPLASSDGFCTQWAKNACSQNVITNCAAQGVEACVATQKSFCLSITDGYSQRFAPPCLKAVKDAYADAKLSAAERETVLRLGAPCDKLIKGPGGVGATCSRDADCNTLEDLACVTKALGDGTCQVPKIEGGGHSCSLPQQTCAVGFFCDGTNCLARRELDEPCSATLPCAETLKCPVEGDAGGAICVAKAEIGAACASDDDCKSSLCAKSASAAAGVCTAEIILRADDQICGNLR